MNAPAHRAVGPLCVKTNPAEAAEGVVGVGYFDRIIRIDRINRIVAPTILHYRVAGWAVERVVKAGDGDAVLDFVRQLAVERVGGAETHDVDRKWRRGRERSHCLSHVTLLALICGTPPKTVRKANKSSAQQ